MEYMAYLEDKQVMEYDEYESIKEVLLRDDENRLELIEIRRITFRSMNTEIENREQQEFAFVIRNHNKEEIYLEKRNVQNNIVTKTVEKVSQEECLKVLNKDFDWMRYTNKQLVAEFYVQLKLHDLHPDMITEYQRKMGSFSKNQYIVFDEEIRRIVALPQDFFKEQVEKFDCKSCDKIFVTYKKEVTIPDVVSNILHISQSPQEHIVMAF